MALQTTAEQLEAVQTAITAVLAGQSWSQDGVTYTRANLDALQRREDRLLARYAREQGNRPFCQTAFSAGGADDETT